MQFAPSFYKALLTLGKTPVDQLERVYAVNGDMLLLVRVKVREMMRRVSLSKHSNHNTEEPAQFRHRQILAHHPTNGRGPDLQVRGSFQSPHQRAAPIDRGATLAPARQPSRCIIEGSARGGDSAWVCAADPERGKRHFGSNSGH